MVGWLFKSFLVFLFLFSLSELVFGQHKSWRQYTIDDGLTGNAVFGVLQDSRGFLWFVTDQGICKFNGYEFIRPIDTSAFIGNEAFVPIEDSEGRIWFARLDKSLWVIENDTVRAWEYNNVLDLYKEKFGLIDQLGIDENKTVWIALRGHGFLLVDSIGSHHILRGSENLNILFSKIGKNVISSTQFTPISGNHMYSSEKVVDIINLQQGQHIKIDQFKKSSSSSDLGSAWPLRNGDLIFSYNGQFEIIRNNNIVSRFSTKLDNPKIFETEDGKVLVASYLGLYPGFFYYESIRHFEQGLGENILPGYLVSDILIDREGGWWATTLNGGIFFCKNPDIEIYDKSMGLSSSNILRLTNDGNHTVYASLQAKEIWKIDGTNATTVAIPLSSPEGPEISALYYDTLNQRLWRSPLEFFEDDKWTPVIDPSSGLQKFIAVKKFYSDPSGKSIWISSSYGFYKIDNQTLELTFFNEGEKLASSMRTFSVAEDKAGTIWVATIDGLKVWNDDHYENPPFTLPVLRYQARDIELLPDGSIVIAFSGGGILIRDTDGNLTQLTKEDGLSSDFIPKIYCTSDGRIYACSNTGLNYLFFHDNHWKIEIITTKQGLPSNLINDVTVLDGELWVATEKGLARIRERLSSFPVTKPILEKFSINNQDTLYRPDIKLSHLQKNIAIKFYSLHFRSEGDLLYRYRLTGADITYNYTKNREVNFPNPAPGKYYIEVQAQNENGEWSEPAKWSFVILPPWWRTWWFLSFVLIAFFAGIIIFYKNRIKGIRHNNEINNKIKDLEMAALRAQMNPHFIFNCLGSIQQFIAENDSASATRYLARFAKLVRLSLHSSVDGKHSLTEEIEMLDNYLALEQMRFKGKFKYEITKDSIVNPDDICLPPMLIQPFVENALKHGMKNQANEGLIKIDFEQMDGTLQVTVTDNGPGLSTKHLEDGKAHRSFGMKLTKRRLDILSDHSPQNNFTMENIIGHDSEVKGARAKIRIPEG